MLPARVITLSTVNHNAIILGFGQSPMSRRLLAPDFPWLPTRRLFQIYRFFWLIIESGSLSGMVALKYRTQGSRLPFFTFEHNDRLPQTWFLFNLQHRRCTILNDETVLFPATKVFNASGYTVQFQVSYSPVCVVPTLWLRKVVLIKTKIVLNLACRVMLILGGGNSYRVVE